MYLKVQGIHKLPRGPKYEKCTIKKTSSEILCPVHILEQDWILVQTNSACAFGCFLEVRQKIQGIQRKLKGPGFFRGETHAHAD